MSLRLDSTSRAPNLPTYASKSINLEKKQQILPNSSMFLSRRKRQRKESNPLSNKNTSRARASTTKKMKGTIKSCKSLKSCVNENWNSKRRRSYQRKNVKSSRMNCNKVYKTVKSWRT